MDSSMGHRLRQARIAKRLTQEELADAVDVRAMSISRFERGQLDPSRATLVRLAKALGVTTDHLLEGDGDDDESGGDMAAQAENEPPAAA